MLQDLQEIYDEAMQLHQPLDAVAARILSADVLSWAGRPDDARQLLENAERVARDSPNVPPAARLWQLIQVARRQMQAAATAGDHATVSAVASDAIELIEEQRRRVSLPYLADSQLRDLWAIYALGVGAARALGDWDLLLARADLLKSQGAMRWLQVPVSSVQQIRAQLAYDEAVIYWFWATRRRLLIMAVDAGRITCEQRELTDLDRAALDAVVTDISELSGEGRWLDAALSEVSELVMPSPGVPPLRDKERVFLSPHGLLHGLPLHALSWNGAPLIETFVLTYIPSFGALTARPSAACGHEVVIGISEFAEGRPPIPSAVEEAKAVARCYPGADLIEGPRATTAAMRSRAASGLLQQARLLHLATHGEDGPREDPLAAKLILADGALSAEEIRSWRLEAELVVLSACWSSQRAVVGRDGADLFADEMYGLQSAFFAAGARRIVGSLWPARDETAALTMTLFHAACSSGFQPDAALRSAMLAIRTQRPLAYDWAPYQLILLGR